MLAPSRIDFYKVRLDINLFAWKPCLNELSTDKIADCDISVDLLVPGLSRAVRLKHQSDGPRHHPRIPIAAISHAAEKPVRYTLLTRFVISIERRRRA